MATTALRGITWDHARGFDPLARGAQLFAELRPGARIEWQRRSLARFGEEPLLQLAEQFDLLVIDHPFCGEAAESGCLLDLSGLLPQSFLERLRRDSVGPSTESYWYGGALWALPTDAAAQVACYRPDLLTRLEMAPPARHADVIALGKHARARGLYLGLPLCPGDASCTLLSLLSNLGCRLGEQPDSPELDAATTLTALELLRELSSLCHPSCTSWSPIQTFEAMIATDEIVYVPYAFGYSNYARRGRPKPLRFANLAGPGSDARAGSLLGGAGCALSRGCRDVPLALEYLQFVHAEEHQRGAYFDAGGQPGLLSAWHDERLNEQAHRFFEGTLETLEKAYRRPRFPGFVPFLQQAGQLVLGHLRGSSDAAAVVDELRRAYARARSHD
jgi:multiple sugar transport system substrate-binding protein